MTLNRELTGLTAVEMLQRYKSKDLSPVEVVSAAIERIEKLNPYVNAFCYIDAERAIADAKESESRWQRGSPQGLIDGVPCSVKDLVLTRDMPTRKGSRTVRGDDNQDTDAPVAARLRDSGGVLIGKTTTCEFGWKGVTDSPLTGVTRNPWNIELTPGGSSGGAAVASALNMGTLHVGSDAGGSIRIPCAFTGTFGIKPSFGYVPQWPVSAMGTLSHLGPMTRTVDDCALMLTVIGCSDIRDFYCMDNDARNWSEGISKGVTGMRIAYSPTLGYAAVDRDVESRVDECAHLLAKLGAHVDVVDPGFRDPTSAFKTLWYAGAANSVSKLEPSVRTLLDEGLLQIAEEGNEINIIDYMRAIDKRIELAEQMVEFHTQWDLLLTPTLPITAFPVGQNVPDDWPSDDWISWSPFCHPFNLTQQPAASVPFGFAGNGMPVGVQLVGPKFRDDLVLRAAYSIGQALPAEFPTEQNVMSSVERDLA